jgi:hypothetical protein
VIYKRITLAPENFPILRYKANVRKWSHVKSLNVKK